MSVSTLAAVQTQQPELIVDVDRQQVYLGESLVYRVTLNHVETPTEPELTEVEGFQIALLGSQPLNSQQVTIINGRRSEIIRRGHQYIYRITPTISGLLTIPAPTAQVNGETLTGQAIEVRVTAPDDQDLVVLDYSVDRASVYPMQPFTASLVMAIKSLPEPYSDKDPLTVQPQPPALSLPWMDDNQLPAALQPQQSWRSLLEPIMSRRGDGVQINNISSSSAFSLFESRATGFHPQPTQTQRKDSDGNDVDYWEYRFQRTIIPQRTGTWHLGPVSLKGTFADSVQGRALNGIEIYAMARDISVTVKDVPAEGRPDSYIGAVGTFSALATLAPETVRVGDPMTLTLTLSGEGTLAEARPPVISEMPEVTAGFRTYEATEETSPGQRQFVYSLRPLDADIDEFPSIPISCFDVNTEEYVTLQTSPIPISVSEAETLSGTDIVASEADGTPVASGLQTSVGGVFANITDADALRNDYVHAPSWFAAWGIMLVAWVGLSWGIGQVRERTSNPTIVRQRNAPGLAAAALSAADSHLQSGESAAVCDSVRRAVAGVTAAWANVPDEGLTARDAGEHLRQLGVDKSLAQRAETLLEECDATRYGAAGTDLSPMVEQAHVIVKELVQHLRRHRSEVS